MHHDHAAAGIDPGGGSLVLSLALLLWTAIKASRAFVAFLDRHSGEPPPTKENTRMSTTDLRPRPLRTAASWVGGLLALISGLVGADVFTAGQGDAITGVIHAVLTALAAFGVVVATERRVTPTSDPRDDRGRPLAPSADDLD